MKKIICGVLAALTLCTSTAFADEITMYLNGTEIAPLEEAHQPAIVQDGILYLPMRNVFEAMGAVVEWSEDFQTVSGGVRALDYKTTVGTYIIIINNEEFVLDEPTFILNDRTLVLPEAVVNCFGADIDWDSENSVVQITYDPENKKISTIDFTDLEVQ